MFALFMLFPHPFMATVKVRILGSGTFDLLVGIFL